SAVSYNTIKWDMGDGNIINPGPTVTHLFSIAGNYTISMIVDKGACIDTIIKTIAIGASPADIILTGDTTLCAGTKTQLRTRGNLGFCWSPQTYLDNPNSPSPVTSTPVNITYYYTAEITGSNLIVNGDFSQGTAGFTSEYNLANPNLTEGEYFVGSNPSAWNASLSGCTDHTSGNGNMMLINGSPVYNVNVWKQTITVVPNTNYAFSTWVEALWPPNPAQLQFSINGKEAGSLISASLPTCTWTQFYTTWNSGNNTSASISLVNKNTAIQGNDFALDDISFSPISILKDSVVIKIETPSIKTNNDTIICAGKTVQLKTTGNAVTYKWSPAFSLSNPNIANPVATVTATTQYIVTATGASGCTAMDSVTISIDPLPVITKTRDTTICHDKTIQLNATGGNSYTWLPAGSLSNANIANPVASPVTNTTYYVTVTNNTNCINSDSVSIVVKQIPVFTISGDTSACLGKAVHITASGGDVYSWTPVHGLDNASYAVPSATPGFDLVYTVKIIESTCNDSASLSTRFTVFPLPVISATSSNDVTCSKPVTQLNATGGIKYLWQPATGLNDSTSAAPLSSPSATSKYIVWGTDANGCYNYDSVSVLVKNTGDLIVNLPNAFTPNGDGKNDCFGISRYAGLLQHAELSVYNRFGVRVFHTTNALNCWDGRYNGKLQDTGGFVYWLKASTFCGEIFKKGVVMLLH
ncbi:MAG: gliding motility-associated C-terminal domain-containing protein, partial [Bacteroidota bacterium]